MAWGYILSVDLYGCPREKLTCEKNIISFNSEVILAVNMKPYGKYTLEHFASHDAEAVGYTLSQLIETSNLTCHFAENIEKAFIDLFSCKLFDPDVVIKVAHKYFEFKSFNKFFIERGKGSHGTHKVVMPVVRELCGTMGRVA